jgi:hypothetical protein
MVIIPMTQTMILILVRWLQHPQWVVLVMNLQRKNFDQFTLLELELYLVTLGCKPL